MNLFTTRKTVPSLLLGVTLLITGAMLQVSLGHDGEHHEEDKPKVADKPKAQEGKAQEVKVTIDGGYHPGKIKVHPGRAVRLTLIRKETHGCGDVVKFPGLTELVDGREVTIERTLQTGEQTTITFTPKAKGTLHFTCGMGMYKGSIVVK